MIPPRLMGAQLCRGKGSSSDYPFPHLVFLLLAPDISWKSFAASLFVVCTLVSSFSYLSLRDEIKPGMDYQLASTCIVTPHLFLLYHQPGWNFTISSTQNILLSVKALIFNGKFVLSFCCVDAPLNPFKLGTQWHYRQQQWMQRIHLKSSVPQHNKPLVTYCKFVLKTFNALFNLKDNPIVDEVHVSHL